MLFAPILPRPASTVDAEAPQLRAVASPRVVGITGDGDREEKPWGLAEAADVIRLQIDALLHHCRLGPSAGRRMMNFPRFPMCGLGTSDNRGPLPPKT